MESFLYSKQKDLYTFYNDRVRWVIVFIELRYKKFPVPLLNEIRAAQDHVTRCFEPDKSDNREYGRVKGQVIEPSVINIDKWHGQQEYDPTAECITLY